MGLITIAGLEPATLVSTHIHTQHAKEYSGVHRGHLPPHIFAVAAAAYQGMVRENKDHCCVISGTTCNYVIMCNKSL